MQRIVNQALKRYSEDRIGMVDYALESGGVCVRSPHFAEPGPVLAAPLGFCRAAVVLGGQGSRWAGITAKAGEETWRSPDERNTILGQGN